MEARELIGRMAGGDRDAFAEFYDRYAPLVYPLVLRILRDSTEAADVLQDVFWEAWQGAPTYDASRGTPEAWMVTRARSRAIDRVRSIRRRGEAFVPPMEEDHAPDPAEPAAAVMERAENQGLLPGALEQLPEVQREVIELAYYAGLTQTEIAQQLKQPLGTVKTRIRLGLERLRLVVKGA